MSDESERVRFLVHVRDSLRLPDECLPWSGPLNVATGYGETGGGGDAHRRVWALLVGPIPEGLELDHLCRNRACVNPRHLEPVRPWVNKMRGESPASHNAAKDRCKHGHPFDAANTYYPKRDGGHSRQCRTCRRLAERERLKRLRLADAL